VVKNSIIIPTYNKLSLLKTCIESIIDHTDLTNTEVIIVSNGCKDGTIEYVSNLDPSFKLIQWPEPIGYPNAVNMGICASKGEYIILLNNDVKLLSNTWLPLLIDPFITKQSAGVTGLVKDLWNNKPWVIFFCASVKKEVFNKVGLLDITFTPGTGEDVDFCLRAGAAGYTIHQIPEQVLPSDANNHNMKHGPFPIWHIGAATFNGLDVADVTTKSRNILLERYGTQYP